MTHSGDISEQDILRSIQDGNMAAMAILYNRYVRYFTAICSRYVTNEEDLRDILQESILKIYTSIRKFEYRGTGSLKKWMAKIVLNETIKTLKRDTRFEFVDEIPDEESDTNDRDPDVEDIPIAVIHEMIRKLPPGYRTVFNLYVFEEKSHKEIAAELNIKESTSASQFHRAKLLLSNQIKHYRILNNK